MLILGLLGMYFDAAVGFFTMASLFFIMAMVMLCHMICFNFHDKTVLSQNSCWDNSCQIRISFLKAQRSYTKMYFRSVDLMKYDVWSILAFWNKRIYSNHFFSFWESRCNQITFKIFPPFKQGSSLDMTLTSWEIEMISTKQLVLTESGS